MPDMPRTLKTVNGPAITTATYSVNGTEYLLRRNGGRHNPVKAFVKNGDGLKEVEISELSNSELVEAILREEFGIDSIEAMQQARSKLNGIMTSLISKRSFAHHH
jgi:hypothetical protein